MPWKDSGFGFEVLSQCDLENKGLMPGAQTATVAQKVSLLAQPIAMGNVSNDSKL